jgi:hypothetical protein
MNYFTKEWLVDALERTLWTAFQAGFAIILASEALDVSVLKAAAIAAALSAVKSIGARFVGDSSSAGTIPKKLAKPKKN